MGMKFYAMPSFTIHRMTLINAYDATVFYCLLYNIMCRTVLNKMSQAKVGNAWFLRSDWSVASQEAGPHVVGVAWLRHISDPNLVR